MKHTPINRLPAIHPGEILMEEVLRPLGLPTARLASLLKVPARRLEDVVDGRKAVTAELALRLARYLGTTAEFWVRLQASYDLRVAEARRGTRIDKEVSPREAA